MIESKARNIQSTVAAASRGTRLIEVRVSGLFPCRRSIPQDAGEAIDLAKLLLNERGYVVLSTQSPGRGYQIGERTKVLWSIRQEQPFSIVGETDQNDWDEQIDVIRRAYPYWLKKECDESRSRFWRAVTD